MLEKRSNESFAVLAKKIANTLKIKKINNELKKGATPEVLTRNTVK